MYKKFSIFIIAGTIGFFTDFLSFLFFINLGINVNLSRALAFILAVQTTYIINNKYTFSEKKGSKLRYFTGQTIGVVINYSCFIYFYNYLTPNCTIIAFIGGSVIALIYNFSVANLWAFKNIDKDNNE